MIVAVVVRDVEAVIRGPDGRSSVTMTPVVAVDVVGQPGGMETVVTTRVDKVYLLQSATAVGSVPGAMTRESLFFFLVTIYLVYVSSGTRLVASVAFHPRLSHAQTFRK